MEYQLPKYIGKMLHEYGNTVVSDELYYRFGEKTLLKLVKKQTGLKCSLRIATHHFDDVCGEKYCDITYILEVI